VSESHPHWIDDEQWTTIRRLVPVTCVDLVPVRAAASGADEFGLIERDSPFGLRWCQIGGRLRHGEPMRDGLLRHLQHTLSGLDVVLPPDPQPDYVMQWFPVLPPEDTVDYGYDPRQHAVALCFLAEAAAGSAPTAVEGGEAVRFGWFSSVQVAAMDAELWPGTGAMIREISRRWPRPASEPRAART
jgi:ADP-ribose pyrophosphatase YjhB (NUDIX family)